ncbi:MAG TPA: type I polyketide synthase, partial [Thermoanaerobaculia bacterium]|nr:type I polyketide synthase [Thermoanaerobaculia bacterium]
TPSPHIPWGAIPVRVPVQPTPWPRGGRPRRAGVSSFGFSGTNVHLVVEEAPATDPVPAAERRVHVLPVSARSREALKGLLAGYRQRLSEESADLGALCFTAAVRRTHHPFRAALVGTSQRELVEQLDLLDQEGYAAGPTASGWGEGEPPGTVFLFPGQGSQWPGMALDLLRHEPVFRRAMEECEAALAPHTGWHLLSELAGDGCEAFLSQIDQVQPALFAVEVALAELWMSWGIVPHALVGQSMGEVAAACVAGALSLDDAARIICRRSRLLRRISGRGAMLAVELPLEEAAEAIRGREDRVSIAVGSGPRSTVLSGDPAVLDEVAAALGRRQVFCRLVKVDVASHSPQVDVLGDDLRRELEGIEPRPARFPMVSTVTGKILAGGELDAAYWWANLRQPVLFAAAVTDLLQRGHRFFLEMSPHPILLPSVEQCIEHGGRVGEAHAVASVWRDLPEQTEILGNLGLLYTRGYPVPWRRLYGDTGPWAELPAYPWQRSRFWIDAPVRSLAPGTHPLLGQRFDAAGSGLRFWDHEIDLRRLPWLADHRVEEAVVFPAAGWLAMVAAASRQLYGEAAEIRDAEFVAPLTLDEEPRRVQLRIEDGPPARFEIWSARGDVWELHARGALRRGGAETLAPVAPRPSGRLRSGEEHYRGLERRGLRYGPRFRAVREIWTGEREALARVTAGADGLHPAVLDACLQTFAGAALRGTWLPAGLRRLTWYGPPPAEDTELWALASWRAAGREIEGDLRVTGRDGDVVLVAEGVRLAPLARNAEEPLLQLIWREADPTAQLLSPEGSWGVLGDGAVAGQVRARLEAAGVHVVPLAEAPAGVFYVPDLPDEPDPDRIEAEILRLAHLVQKLSRLVLVTRGAVATEDGAAVLPGQSALWGLGKVIAEE